MPVSPPRYASAMEASFDACMLTTCAAQVPLVGSHADEVDGGADDVRSSCEAMAQAVHVELERHRAAKKREMAEVESLQVRSEEAEQRLQQLTRVLSHPLKLSAGAVAVSAKTGQGFDELRRMIVEAAFDRKAFPTFGTTQPGTYSAIHEKLLHCHPEESSVVSNAVQAPICRSSAGSHIVHL